MQNGNGKIINIGLLGCGNVGTEFVRLLSQNRDMIYDKTGMNVDIKKILVKDKKKKRGVPESLVTNNPDEILDDKKIDLVVELIGGTDKAKEYVLRAIDAGKHIVTANKALIAAHGKTLISMANNHKRRISFEASVCAGIPIIRSLRESLASDRIDFICGIVNGTCNYILTQMGSYNLTFQEALKKAIENGFCEPDPALDITGKDSAQKLAILATLAFGSSIETSSIYTEGIDHMQQDDIRITSRLGFKIKHVAIAKRHQNGIELRVNPVLLDKKNILSNVDNEFNAVIVSGAATGDLIFTGKGAGPMPTSAAVLSDVIEIAKETGEGKRSNFNGVKWSNPDLIKIDDTENSFYLRIPIYDRPGAIGSITTILGENGVSISRADAELIPDKVNYGNVCLLTHRCVESRIKSAIKEIFNLQFLRGIPTLIRIGYH
ncbi:MAG: homoserine dehydrogenase [Planctomycetes bacterium]|nr:homoserine dehydrogenase [Planctomycetota bacterium]